MTWTDVAADLDEIARELGDPPRPPAEPAPADPAGLLDRARELARRILGQPVDAGRVARKRLEGAARRAAAYARSVGSSTWTGFARVADAMARDVALGGVISGLLLLWALGGEFRS